MNRYIHSYQPKPVRLFFKINWAELRIYTGRLRASRDFSIFFRRSTGTSDQLRWNADAALHCKGFLNAVPLCRIKHAQNSIL